MAESVVCYVVERLSSLLVEEAQFLSRVRGEVEKIQGELERMRCFLKDADARQNEKLTIRNWVGEIRELAHNTEDVLEMYAFKIPLKQDPTFLDKFVSIFRDGLSLHQVGSEIQRIRTSLSEITTSMQDYGIKQISGGESPRYRRSRRSYHHNVERDFVGLDDEVDMLVAHLTNREDSVNCHKVVSICGMGGLGKSTIARKIYHHDDVKKHFQAFAWASISQNWQQRDVLEGLLSKLSKEKKREEIGNLKDDELIEEVYRVQTTKKCLVVLDDIWSFDFWDQMKHAFPTGNSDHDSGSKVIITSRKREVAMPVNSSTFVYEPRFLNPEESWELLKKKAFPRQYSPGISCFPHRFSSFHQ
ncbi:antimicrobial response protein [Lithospermum erythrorhizon]|uniref:Antimicrobial response protein n=1 Tax=Lithospermum erythrorhizon TaxID=34254 RepID=A0AAV3REX4_LITER